MRARQQDTHFQAGKLKGALKPLKNAHTLLNENLILKPAIVFKLVSVFRRSVSVEIHISDLV